MQGSISADKVIDGPSSRAEIWRVIWPRERAARPPLISKTAIEAGDPTGWRGGEMLMLPSSQL